MTNNPHWQEQPVAYRTDPAMPGAVADRLEPPALQIAMSDRPEKPMSPPNHDRAGGDGPRGVEDMLQKICDKIDDNEKRYGSALDELHTRLDTLSGGDDPAGPMTEAVAPQAPVYETPVTEAPQALASNPSDPTHTPAPGFDDAPSDGPRDKQDTFEEIERRVMEFAEGTKPTTATVDTPMDFDSRFRDISAELEDSLAPTSGEEVFETTEASIEPQQAPPQPERSDFEQVHAEPQVFASHAAPEQQQVLPGVGQDYPSEGLQSIEETLANLSGYFERAESQFGRLDSIEDHLNRLAQTMQAAAPQVEQAARQAAQEVLQSIGDEGGQTETMRRLDAIETSLRAINERSEQMDSRTVDALTSMNHTISALSDHLSGHRPAAPEQIYGQQDGVAATPTPHVDVPQAEQSFAPQPEVPHPHLDDVTPEAAVDPMVDASYDPMPHQQPIADDEFAEVRITHGQPEGTHPGPDMSALGAELPDYQPMSGVPGPAPTTPEVHPAAAPQGHYSETPQNNANDFLAAARRAAQAAAHQPDEPAEPKGFFSRFRRKPKAPKDPQVAETSRPKPLLVFAALLLLVVSAVLLYGRLMNKPGGTVTGFFERNTAPISTPRTKTSSKLSLDPQSDQSRASVVMPNLTPAAPAEEREDLRPRRGGEDQLVAPRTTPTSPYLRQRPTASDVTVSPAAPRSRAYAPGQSVQLPSNVQAKRASLTPRVLTQPKTAPIVEAAPHTERKAKVRKIAMPPAAIGPISLRTAAANGNAQAQFEVANRYAKGHGVKKDYEKSWRWYHHAAAQSFAPAQYMLAALYERGLGTKRDLEQAKAWYGRASDLGNVKAMHNLAVMHTGRDGKPADYSRAGKWFAKAAAFGLADSQFNLGILYENGLGVSKSMTEAYKWFALAAKRGDKEAGKRRDLVKLQFEPAVLAKAEQAVRNWKAAPVNKAANRIYKSEAAWAPPGPGAKAESKSSPHVAKAQKLLNKLGYTAGPADGVMGPKTTSAIKDFQMRSGLDATGAVNQELLSHLEALTG